MMRIINFLVLILLFQFSCTKTSNNLFPEGLWIGAYELSKDETDPIGSILLLDFDSDSIKFVSIGDRGLDRLDTVVITKNPYKIMENESLINIVGVNANIVFSTDSLIMNIHEHNFETRLVFKRLNPKLKTNIDFKNCFNHGYLATSSRFQDTIYFFSNSPQSNNSGMVFNGDLDGTWHIVTYKGYQFLNSFHFILPACIIKSCNMDEAVLILYRDYQNEFEIKLKSINTSISKKDFMGNWSEIPTIPRIPPPPPLGKKDQYYHLKIDQDSVQLKIRGWKRKYNNWDITSDGKFIYFKNKLFDYGLWEILHLSDTTLTLKKDRRISDEIIYFKKDLTKHK